MRGGVGGVVETAHTRDVNFSLLGRVGVVMCMMHIVPRSRGEVPCHHRGTRGKYKSALASSASEGKWNLFVFYSSFQVVNEHSPITGIETEYGG